MSTVSVLKFSRTLMLAPQRRRSDRWYIDGALRFAAELRGDEAAQAIQLHIAYAPEPPFNSGAPETAPAGILEQARHSLEEITARREASARRAAQRLGIVLPSGP
jgi:cyclohexyl-isocyanide hydratase